MIRFHRSISVGLILAAVGPTLALASDSHKSGAESFDYPELLVVPRASARLEMEAKGEAGRRWTTHLAMQVSALTTFTAGLLQFGNYDAAKDVNGTSPFAGLAVGGGWLVATSLLAMKYQPYTSASQEVNAMPKGSKRDELARERMAEEAIEGAATLGRRLTWLSFLSNVGANAIMMSKATTGSASIVANAAGLAASIAPIVFPYRWKTVAQEQRDYKKRIYAPIASSTLMSEPGTGRLAPGVALSFQF